ncbi:MAG: fibrobacter succinogenes major paralogous domain-containing protein [Bacteroidales bacterium]|nr:fibrobacter succinogenes major paralogous domain-containing protein [Bacteroidales bacterium]
MKRITLNYTLIITFFLMLIVIGCKKDEQPTIPVLLSVEPSSITDISAISGGNITSDGGAIITIRGVCWGTNPLPTINNSKTLDGTGLGSYTSIINGLQPGTTYHLRAYATNSVGTGYGADILFSSTTTTPILTTVVVSTITAETASSGGVITSDGGAEVTSRGVCWGVNQNPTIANNKTTNETGLGSFTSNITNLLPNTTYYLRAYATNSVGTSYGNEITFTTFAVMDIDGNGYYSISIGTQVWLVENLRVTHYRNGEPIPNVTDNTQWNNLTTGAYCYKYNETNVEAKLGFLYNWYTIADSRNLCPIGWHVATDAEWTTLVNYLGGNSVAGGKMKETGTAHWWSPNTDSDNSSGFTAVPAGQRSPDGSFYFGNACFWTSTSENATNARSWFLSPNDTSVTRYYDFKGSGFNIRCVKD